MSQLGGTIFWTFAITQAIVLLVITPAVVSGVIVEEKQRKTLHYMLAEASSPIAEIVLGKLGRARLLQIGVFLAVGLPILSLLSLFGGVDPILVLFDIDACGTTAFLLSLAAAILIARSMPESRRKPSPLVTFWKWPGCSGRP